MNEERVYSNLRFNHTLGLDEIASNVTRNLLCVHNNPLAECNLTKSEQRVPGSLNTHGAHNQ